MYGIYGQLSKSGRELDVLVYEEALQRLYHGGPDEGGIWRGQQTALGMLRLSIIDLAGGQQPI